MYINLTQLLENKEKLKNNFEDKLSQKEIKEAKKDSHARRKPIGCGITVHVAHGCDKACLYCYIQDMGFKFKPHPYKLNGKQIAYALLSNPYFVPTLYGTYIAVGSVSEPFIFREKALEYLENINKLGNPIQISTKEYIDNNFAKKLKKFNINVLVTIVSKDKRLEPYARSFEERVESIHNLRKNGVKVSIFFRPIIPGINDKEIHDILEISREENVPVVFGIFRATEKNLIRLKKAGYNIDEIIKRLNKYPKNKMQITLKMDDIIEKACICAKNLGLRYFIRASCATSYFNKIPNAAREFIKGGCVSCENSCINKLPEIYDIEEIFESFGLKIKDLNINNKIFVKFAGVEDINKNVKSLKVIKVILETVSRRNVVWCT